MWSIQNISISFSFLPRLIILCVFIVVSSTLACAQPPGDNDTFFLAKKKGLIGKFGKSLTKSPVTEPVKLINPFLRYQGKIIRSIEVSTLGFNENINDTSISKTSYWINLANKFHRNTRSQIVRNNLFFHTGESFLPLLVADNERYLRDLSFLQDARIFVTDDSPLSDSVDVLVLVKDIFSIGGRFTASLPNRYFVEVRDDNINGSGTAIATQLYYDNDRKPNVGTGARLTSRNIAGSFIDWTIGFTTFNNGYNTGRAEELSFYTRVSKPFVSRFSKWTGEFLLTVNENNNVYLSKEFYYKERYAYHFIDLWAGYNLGYKKAQKATNENAYRQFVAIRGFYNKFTELPLAFVGRKTDTFANINGGLLSYTVYKQNYYRTKFIYGFGRNEDAPVGASGTLTGGWTNIQNRKRFYGGLEAEASSLSNKGYFNSFAFKFGAYQYLQRFEDITLLLSTNHFSKLRKLGSMWVNRNFVNFSFTRIYNKTDLSQPLVLQSEFGIPAFNDVSIRANMRTVAKAETVFFNMQKFMGFRFAPFAFTEFALLKEIDQPTSKSNGYTAIGGGIRTRNENLVFGTIELKGYCFPRTIGDMKNYRIELSTKLQFKFNSNFVNKPDFIRYN